MTTTTRCLGITCTITDHIADCPNAPKPAVTFGRPKRVTDGEDELVVVARDVDGNRVEAECYYTDDPVDARETRAAMQNRADGQRLTEIAANSAEERDAIGVLADAARSFSNKCEDGGATLHFDRLARAAIRYAAAEKDATADLQAEKWNGRKCDATTIAANLATQLYDALQVLILNADLDTFDRQARKQAGDACAAYRAVVEDDQNGLGMMRARSVVDPLYDAHIAKHGEDVPYNDPNRDEHG